MTSVAFHEVKAAKTLACDECGCVIDPTETGRIAHQRWHEGRDGLVVDLRAVTQTLERIA